MIRRQDLDLAFRRLLTPGDTLMVHSSMKAIGMVEDGPEAIIQAMLDRLGSSGTLVMMTSTTSFSKTGHFDQLNSPSETGLLTEVFRRFPGVRRSFVPMTSFSAIGAHADDYVQEFNSHLDPTAPVGKMVKDRIKIMLYGTTYSRCTVYHLSEERLQLPYNDYKTFSGTGVDAQGKTRPCSQRYFVRKDMSATKKNVDWIGAKMEADGVVALEPLGHGMLRVFRADIFDQYCSRELEKNPGAFLVAHP